MSSFVIYTGKNKVITVNSKALSKVYRLEKSVPVEVTNDSDRRILLAYIEGSGTSCCGGVVKSRVIFSDKTYCLAKGLNLDDFRKEWTQYWNEKQNQKSS